MKKVPRYKTLIWTFCVVCIISVIWFRDAFKERRCKRNFRDDTRSISIHLKQYRKVNLNPDRKSESNSQTGLRKVHRDGKFAKREAENIEHIGTPIDNKVSETDNFNTLPINKTIEPEEKRFKRSEKSHNESMLREFHLRREDNERRYYTPRKLKVNLIKHAFIINAAHICKTDAKYMTILIVVPSIPRHYSVREVIRKTYGSYSKRPFFITGTTIEVTVRLIYVIGKDGNTTTDNAIMNESKGHGDIVQADFVDSYRNLTRKMLMALKWVSIYCRKVDFVVKVDEDTFVNIPQLAEELHKRPYDVKGSVYGYIFENSPVARTGKYGVTEEEFPLTRYPRYAAGGMYVISGNIIPCMFLKSEYLPYMPIEDVFVTGCLARIVKAKVEAIPGVIHWDDSDRDPCKFVREKRVSMTKVNAASIEKLWKTFNSYQEVCENVNRTNM